MPIEISVNGNTSSVDVDPATRLLYVLRNDLSLNGPRFGCGLGQCGACTVLVNGTPARSCVIPASAAVGNDITTLEGLGTTSEPHRVQAAFIAEQAAQCGYCSNGMILSATALLDRNPDPSDAQIREALEPYLRMFRSAMEHSAGVRRPGSAALDLAYVAAGRLDAFWETGLCKWDLAGGTLMIREAGGIVSGLDGSENYLETGHVLCGSPKIYAALAKLFAPDIRTMFAAT